MVKYLLLMITMYILTSSTNLYATDWKGKDYNQNSEPQKAWFEKFEDSIPITGHEDILDLGCGDGKLTLKIKNRLTTGSIVGIDQSQSMIDFANRHFRKENLEFHVGDMRSFKLDKKFDLIVSFSALHWVKEYDLVFQQAKMHLKPNGRIFFVFSTKFKYFPLENTLNTLYAQNKWKKYFENYDPGYYSHELDPLMWSLSRHGFKVNEMYLRDKVTIFESKEKMSLWLKTWLPQQNQVPTGMGDEFIGEFIDMYSRYGTVSNQGIHWKGFLVKIEASYNPSLPQNKSKL